MESNTHSQDSLWTKIWRPFLGLSIYKKFMLILAGFLFGYLIIALYSYRFIEKLKQELSIACGEEEHLNNTLALLDTFIFNQIILEILIVLVLSFTSFLCVRALVNFLDQMTDSLRQLIAKGDSKSCNHRGKIPVLTQDKIGEVASLVNDLTSHINNISLFRRTIEADETVGEIYNRLAFVFKETLQLDTFIIWEVQQQDDSITAAYSWPPELEQESCILNTSRICRARRTGEVISSTGFTNICPAFPLDDVMTHTCVPMIVSGQVLGVVQFFSLFVDSPEREKQLQISQDLASLYLEEAMPVLHAKRLAGNLHEMATKDQLTGLSNRRFLETNINPLLAGIKRRKSTMGILMCDMDFFKQVNDEHGHDAGDEVLRTLARNLEDVVRESDIVIRYGGEEFMILLTDCQSEQAITVAEKIRETVEDQIFRFEGTTLKKTLSIGVSVYPTDGEGFWECVKYADISLYQAKDTGRNKVLRFDSSMWDGDDY